MYSQNILGFFFSESPDQCVNHFREKQTNLGGISPQWKYSLYTVPSVTDPGFVKREGREYKCRDAALGLKKVAQLGGGGLRQFPPPPEVYFWATFTLWWGGGTVRLPDRPLGLKEKKRKKRGGGETEWGRGRFGPPPLDPPLTIPLIIDRKFDNEELSRW